MGERTSVEQGEGRRRRGRAPWIGLGALALVGGGWWTLGRPDEVVYDGPTRPVERGPLTISVTEAGAIEAREKVVLKCEVDERSTTITRIVPEGTWVEPGDLLVELDASVLQDELYDEEIDVLDTEAEYLAAVEDVEVAKNQARADRSEAELTLRFAREDVSQYVEGEYPKLLMEARNNVTLAEEELSQTRERLDWSQKLHDSGFLAGSELDRDRLAFQRAELEVELARVEVELLQTYTHRRQVAQLEAHVEQAELALERAERKARADVVQAETNLRARERQLERQRAQLADIQRQVEKCTIRSPVAGMVVYATTGRGGWGGDQEPLEVGREVNEQEELIHIPLAESKSARVKVHESALDKVRVGLPVSITVDAVPGRTYRGRVARISPLPDAQSQWLNPDLKVYETEIHLEGDLQGLRTGMTCRAEILVERYADALYVPVHSVVRVGGASTVFVLENERLVPRPVEVGLDNNRMIRVVSGLREGEAVALAPPLREAEAPDGGLDPDELELESAAVPGEDAPTTADAGASEPAEGEGL